MKKTLLILMTVALTQFSFAQAWNGKGDQKIQIGLSAWGYGSGLSGTYDYGITDAISLGGGAHFYFNNKKENGFSYSVELITTYKMPLTYLTS